MREKEEGKSRKKKAIGKEDKEKVRWRERGEGENKIKC